MKTILCTSTESIGVPETKQLLVRVCLFLGKPCWSRLILYIIYII